MGECADRQCFTLKSPHKRLVSPIEYLNSDLAPHTTIIRQVHFGHATLGDASAQFVASERKTFNPLHLPTTPHMLFIFYKVKLLDRPVSFQVYRVDGANAIGISFH